MTRAGHAKQDINLTWPYLHPLVMSLTSYVKDANDFLNKIKDASKNLPVNSILVKSLYINIPKQEGIDAVTPFFTQSDKQSEIPDHILSLANPDTRQFNV